MSNLASTDIIDTGSPTQPSYAGESLQSLATTLIGSPELANEISGATQAALGRPATNVEQLADQAEFSAGINHATLLLQLGELSGGPAPAAAPSGPAPAALNGAVAEITPGTIAGYTDPGYGPPANSELVYGLLNNDALIVTNALANSAAVTLSLAGGGAAVISGFSPSIDVIQLQSHQAASFSGLNITATGAGGANTLISLAQGGTITLPGIAPSSLNASNFSFV